MIIANVIKVLRDSDRYIETIFTEGGCYQFHLFIKSLCPKAKPYITEDNEHVVTLIQGDFYDITGNVSDEQLYTAMTKSEIKEAEGWSFSRTKMLQLGECSVCEEPILIQHSN